MPQSCKTLVILNYYNVGLMNSNRGLWIPEQERHVREKRMGLWEYAGTMGSSLLHRVSHKDLYNAAYHLQERG